MHQLRATYNDCIVFPPETSRNELSATYETSRHSSQPRDAERDLGRRPARLLRDDLERAQQRPRLRVGDVRGVRRAEAPGRERRPGQHRDAELGAAREQPVGLGLPAEQRELDLVEAQRHAALREEAVEPPQRALAEVRAADVVDEARADGRGEAVRERREVAPGEVHEEAVDFGRAERVERFAQRRDEFLRRGRERVELRDDEGRPPRPRPEPAEAGLARRVGLRRVEERDAGVERRDVGGLERAGVELRGVRAPLVAADAHDEVGQWCCGAHRRLHRQPLHCAVSQGKVGDLKDRADSRRRLHRRRQPLQRRRIDRERSVVLKTALMDRARE